MTNSAESLPRILCVDDEPNLLAALERTLFGHYDVSVATGADAALELIAAQPPFAAVISDMRMPGMDGASFLGLVRERQPQAIRILLTGQADTESAIAAVNRGAIFKFLCKPCPSATLLETLEEAMSLRKLQQMERQLLATTLTRAVKTLSDVLSLVAPQAFRRATFVQACVRHALPRLQWPDAWRYEVAAALSQIGYVGVPHDDEKDDELMSEHPDIAYRLVSPIPRLELVAEMIRYQASPPPDDAPVEVARGAAVLRGAILLERHGTRDLGTVGALQALRAARPALPETVIEALADFRDDCSDHRLESVRDLRAGWVLDQDIRSRSGVLILSKGHELSDAAIYSLQSLLRGRAIDELIRVRCREDRRAAVRAAAA